jgi:DNA-directed RNA polymerase specialized sigma24 family protein
MNATNNPEKLSENREAVFTGLYLKAFPSVAKYISRRGGSFDEAKDIFHDALVIFYERSVDMGLDENINETAYLIGIAKNLWLRDFRDKDEFAGLEGIDIPEKENEVLSTHRLLHFLEKAGSKCMQLLKNFYYDNLPLQDIAENFGFSGTRSATVQKYKCLEKVRETVKQKALTYEDFME